MKNILHPQKHSASHEKSKGYKLEMSTDDKHDRDLSVTPEQRHQMIVAAAYRRTQKRSFVEGDPQNDW